MKKLWFSSKTFFDFNSFPSVSILIFVFLISTTRGGPLTHHPPETDLEVGNNSLVAPAGPPHPVGCRYQGSLFAPGEDVVTEEPCLACQCKSAVVCKLRICPETPDPPPPGCIVVHKAKKCCAQLVCNQNLLGHETNRKLSREQKLPAVNSSLSTTLTAAGAEGKVNTKRAGFCVVDGTVYAEGSAMRSSSLCQYCFCIRGEMKCSKPQCVIPMNGCKPRFRSYACCPTNYDCQDSNSTAVVKTTPTSTPIPHFLKGCLVNGKKIAEGEPVLPLQLENHTNPCQTCFCMGGVIHCRQLECDRPIEGCKPITEHGHCCPDRYDCSNLNKLNSKSKSHHQIQSANLIKAPTNSVESTSTASQVPSTTTTTSSTTVSSTTIATASTTTTTTAPSTTITSATTTTAPTTTTNTTTTPTPTTTTTTATMPTTTTTTAAAETTTTTTTTTPKILIVNTTEKAEILPVPASMKMTTAEDPSVLVAASGERKLNANSRPKNKSDAGSREDRQNKDRNHFRYRTSYEDDEKEDSASLSYENTERENLDPNSSLSYEETTDHSGSNSDSEMDNDNAEIAPTEENSVEIEVEGRNDSMESEGKTSLPLQSEVEAEETTNQKLLAGTASNTNALTDSDSDSDTDPNTEKENDTKPKEIKVKKLGTKNPTGSTPSLTDFLTSTTAAAATTTTTTTATVATSVNPSSTPNPTTVVVSNMSEGVSLAGGDSLKEVEATNTSSLSSFSGLSQDSGSGSGSDAEITGSSIINQDVENKEVTSSASPTTTETATTTTATSSVIFTNATTTTTAPTTTTITTTTTSPTTTTTAPPSTSTNPNPSSESVQGQGQPQPTSETTVKNVHFISFGVEDAVVSPMNETAPHFESQLTYDNNALKISLIPPTPPKGYPKRIHSSHHHNSSKGPSSHTDTASPPSSSQGGGEAVNSIIQSSGAGSGPGRKDELGNAIMDVPVSTSLYNNGFYRSGGMIITDDSQRGSIELEISSNRPFPGQVFDDGDHSHGIQKQHGMASPPPAPAPGPAPVPAQVPAPATAPVSIPVPVPVQASAPESQSNSHKKAHFDSPPLPLLLTSIKPPYPSSPLPTLSDNNPARTYSKFGIQDSTYYRYGYGNGNGNNNGNPPPPTRAHVNMNPHNSPIPNQHHQYHHRYYNAPEHEHFVPQNPYAGFEQVINQDQDQEDVTYEEVDDDDVGEGVSFEEQEQSLEVQNQNPEIENLGNNQFNYQKKPGTVSTLRPLPTFVFPQNPLEETSTPIYNSSTKIQIQIPPKSHSQQQNPNQNQNQYTQQNPIASGTKKVPGYNYNYNYNKHQQQLQLPQQQPQKPQQQGHGQGSVGFKPAVAFPFALPKKPAGLEFNLGLKLSGCNIYGKMYNVEDVILELSSSCVRCLCTEMGVQCSEILC